MHAPPFLVLVRTSPPLLSCLEKLFLRSSFDPTTTTTTTTTTIPVMPPIDFRPSHASPFKSTLSSAQQPRSNHSPHVTEPGTDTNSVSGSAGWPSELSLGELDPSDWKYLSEGGKNLLVRYDPAGAPSSRIATRDGCLALRVRKTRRASGHEQDDDEEEDGDLFAKHVIVPLLGGDSDILPYTLAVPVQTEGDKRVLDTIAARIEIDRPAHRRAADGINADKAPRLWAVEDLTAPVHLPDGSVSNVLAIEIKPKWGYLPRLPDSSPNHDVKSQHSRFRMHKVHKHPNPECPLTWQDLDQAYDPLDLYSSDPTRIAKAVSALYADWVATDGQTNNLRFFWNGAVVRPDEQERVRAHLDDGSGSEEKLETLLTSVLVPALKEKTLGANSVLERLAHLQASLDDTDVEGLSLAWEAVTHHPLGQAGPDPEHAILLAEPTLDEMVSAISASDPKAGCSVSVAALRRQTIRFLLAASFKDCSMLIRLPEQGAGQQKTKLIDLDPKPIGKLARFAKLDAEIVASFRAWLETNQTQTRGAWIDTRP